MKVRFSFQQLSDKDLYCLRKIYSMIHISLQLDNMYLELQKLQQMPYNRQTFMHRLAKDGRDEIKKNAFATMKRIKMYYYFNVFCIILMHYIVINFLFKKIKFACPKVDDLYCPWKF